MWVVTDPTADIRVELDYAQQTVWVLDGGAKHPTDEIKYGMRFANGAWNPIRRDQTKGSLKEIKDVTAWLQHYYPGGLS